MAFAKVRYGAILSMALFFLVFALLCIYGRGFFTAENLVRNLLMPASMSSVIACGMTLVMRGGGIDLSMGATAGLGALTGAALGTNVVSSIAAAMFSGMILGSLNGLFISVIGINPFIVTLTTSFVAKGLQFLVSLQKAQSTALLWSLPMDRLGSSPVFQIGTSLLVIIFLYVFIEKTKYGRYVKAIGENSEVAIYSGIPVRFYSWMTYVIGSVLAGLSGVMLTSYEGLVRVGSGDNFLLDAFLLPLLGKAVFGRLSIAGTVFAALFLAMIVNGLYILGLPPSWVNAMKGVLLFSMVVASQVGRR